MRHPTHVQQTDLAATLSVGLGLPIPKSNTGSLLFRVVEGRPVREQLRLLHLNTVQLSKLLQENVPSYKKGKPASSADAPAMLRACIVPGVLLLFPRRALQWSSCAALYASALRIRRPKCWSFSFSIVPSNGCSGLISFKICWLDLLAVQGTLKRLLQHHSSEAPFFGAQPSLWSNSVIHTWLVENQQL